MKRGHQVERVCKLKLRLLFRAGVAEKVHPATGRLLWIELVTDQGILIAVAIEVSECGHAFRAYVESIDETRCTQHEFFGCSLLEEIEVVRGCEIGIVRPTQHTDENIAVFVAINVDESGNV